MSRYTFYQNSDSLYFILNGYIKCSSCTKKGVKECDRTFLAKKFDALTAQRNRLTEASRRKGEEIQRMLAEATRMQLALSEANAKRERLQCKADDLLEKQKKMLMQELESLDELDHIDSPPIASFTVFVGMDNAQLEQMFKLEPRSISDFLSPIPIDCPLQALHAFSKLSSPFLPLISSNHIAQEVFHQFLGIFLIFVS